MKRRTKERIENILLVVGMVAAAAYFTFCFYVWNMGYDSLYQYFNMIR